MPPVVPCTCGTIGAAVRWGAIGPTVGEGDPTATGTTRHHVISTTVTGSAELSFGTGGTANVNNDPNGPVLIPIWGTFVNNSTATTVRLQWAQNTSQGTATTVQTNSTLVAHRH